MHSPRPVSAESTLRGRTARALYHIPAGMCQKTPIRTDREGERTRIRTGGTINTSMPQHRNAKPAPSPAEQVRLPLQWCVYFRALHWFHVRIIPTDRAPRTVHGNAHKPLCLSRATALRISGTAVERRAIRLPMPKNHLRAAFRTSELAAFTGNRQEHRIVGRVKP